MEETGSTPTPFPIEEAGASLAEVLLRPLSRAFLPAAAVIVPSAIGVRVLHPTQATMAAHTVDGTVTLTQERPEAIEALDVVYRPKTLTIVKLTGAGGVMTISLTGPQPSNEEKWALEWDLREHPFTRETSIAHLTPGEYDLVFRYRDGERADLGYTYNQGGGPLAQRMGLVEGLLVATGFVAAATIFAAAALRVFVLVQRSRAPVA